MGPVIYVKIVLRGASNEGDRWGNGQRKPELDGQTLRGHVAVARSRSRVS